MILQTLNPAIFLSIITIVGVACIIWLIFQLIDWIKDNWNKAKTEAYSKRMKSKAEKEG